MKTASLFNQGLRQARKNIGLVIADEAQWIANSRVIYVIAQAADKIFPMRKINQAQRIQQALEAIPEAQRSGLDSSGNKNKPFLSWDPSLDGRPALNAAAIKRLTGQGTAFGWFMRMIGKKFNSQRMESVARAMWEAKNNKKPWSPPDSEGFIRTTDPSGQAQPLETRFQDPYYEAAVYLIEGFTPQQIKGKISTRKTQSSSTLPETFSDLSQDTIVSAMSGSLQAVREMVQAQIGTKLVEVEASLSATGTKQPQLAIQLDQASRQVKGELLPGLTRTWRFINRSLRRGAALVVDPSGEYARALKEIALKEGRQVYEITAHTPEGKVTGTREASGTKEVIGKEELGLLDIAERAAQEKALVLDYTKRSIEGIDWKGNLDTHGFADFLNAVEIEQLYGRGARRPGTITRGHLYYREGNSTLTQTLSFRERGRGEGPAPGASPALGSRLNQFLSEAPLVKELTTKLEQFNSGNSGDTQLNSKELSRVSPGSGSRQTVQALELLNKAKNQGIHSLTPMEKVTLSSYIDLARTKSMDAISQFHQNIHAQMLIRPLQEALIKAQERAQQTQGRSQRGPPSSRELTNIQKIYEKALDQGKSLGELGIKEGAYESPQVIITKITTQMAQLSKPILKRALKKASTAEVKALLKDRISQIEAVREATIKGKNPLTPAPLPKGEGMGEGAVVSETFSFSRSKTLTDSYGLG
ncbi:MAG: hypothetical protein AAB037_04180, partial [Chloroflexota bacterium]